MHVCEGGGEAGRERERIVILLTSMTGLGFALYRGRNQIIRVEERKTAGKYS